MARRNPILLLLPLLAACATTSHAPRECTPSYLQGVNSRFSVRLDNLLPDSSPNQLQTLPNAVVAGDNTFTVASSIFCHGEMFAMDLVVQNRGSDDLDLHRTNIQLVDNMGNRLVQTTDWDEASHYGLRSRVNEGREVAGHSRPDVTSMSTPATSSSSSGSDAINYKTVPTASTGAIPIRTDSGGDFSWLSELKTEDIGIVASDILHIKAGESKPYWVYWSGKDIEYPLTAIVMVNNKRLLFKFDRP